MTHPFIPRALAETDKVCSSVIGSTKPGINMTAVADMGRIIKETAALSDMGAPRSNVFHNAVETNPFIYVASMVLGSRCYHQCWCFRSWCCQTPGKGSWRA